MKSTNKTFKNFSRALICILLSTAFIAFTSCSHKHQYVEKIQVEAACGKAGVMLYTCKKCGETTTEAIPATGNHNYGQWVAQSADSMRRSCIVCGAVQIESFSSGSTLNGNTSYSYSTFSSFVADCNTTGKNLEYKGQSTNIKISLGSGDSIDSCENKNVVIPSNVTDVEFIGMATGSPYSNFTIELSPRVIPINVTFTDVRIESQNTIFTSNSTDIQLSIKMKGSKCSFINVSKASRGADGEDGFENDSCDSAGKNGSNGTPAFNLNGNVTIVVSATYLQIVGGEGGDGGNGGHLQTSSARPGGNGGNGGNAIAGASDVKVYVKEDCVVNILGGAGGIGGRGGDSTLGYFGKNKKGANGSNGLNGSAGCQIIMQ